LKAYSLSLHRIKCRTRAPTKERGNARHGRYGVNPSIRFFGFPSVVLADANNQTGHHGLFVQRPMSTMLSGRTGAVNDAAKPFNAREKGSFAELPFVPNRPVLSRSQLRQTKALDRID
jgi:hypothetical protein